MTTIQRKKGPTIHYGFIQATYWMQSLVIASFAAVFLGGRGFSTAQVGTIMAIGALVSALIQQFSGSFADKHDNIPLKYMVMLFAGICLFCFLMLWLLPKALWSTFVFYLTAYTMNLALSPLLTSLCIQFSNNNYDINFGLARSFGSLGYALAALAMGNITDALGSEIVAPIYCLICAVILVILFLFPIPVKDTTASAKAGKELIEQTETEAPSSMGEFLKKYHRFLLLNLGFIIFWLSTNIMSTFMIYFIEDLGGTAGDMGVVFSLLAFSEIPCVMFGNNIMKRIGADKMLRLSAIGGILQALFFALAPTVFLFKMSALTGLLKSGLYQVSAVYYCYSIVHEQDIVKGQTILGAATGGLCPALGNLLGGILLGAVTTKFILLMCVIMCVIACVIIFIATDPKLFKNEPLRRI